MEGESTEKVTFKNFSCVHKFQYVSLIIAFWNPMGGMIEWCIAYTVVLNFKLNATDLNLSSAVPKNGVLMVKLM